MVVQWLGLNALGPGQSSVRELRSCKPHSAAKKKKKKKKKSTKTLLYTALV